MYSRGFEGGLPGNREKARITHPGTGVNSVPQDNPMYREDSDDHPSYLVEAAFHQGTADRGRHGEMTRERH